MPAALIAVVAVALLTATGLSVATVLLRSPAEVVLATFVLGFAEVVALVLVLSPLGAVRREALIAAMVVVFAAAGTFWWRSGRPLPSVDLSRLRGSAPLAVLGIVFAGTLAYVVALAVGTPPNTWDSLVYHLARAAFWRQEGGAGYIEDAYDGRLNANPPNGELALTFVLELARDERLAGFVQLFAALACAVAVFALARRIGLSAREAAFGSLLFLTLPIVVLQSSTTQNDLVVAAMLLAATVFVGAESRRTLALCGLAVALAMGTKVTAVFALPVLCAVALLSPPKAARADRIAALGVGALAGSYWYVVNLVETGRFLGRRPDTELLALGDLEENVLAAFARVLDAFDLSGAEGTSKFVLPTLLDSDVLAYVVAAVVLCGSLLLVSLFTSRTGRDVAFAAGGLALLPLAIAPAGYVLWRVFAKVHDVVGGPGEPLPAGEWPPQTTASETLSWFGPLGPAIVAGAAAAGFALYRRVSGGFVILVLAAAPLTWLVLFSLAIGYDVWQGRFFVYPLALSASLAGIALRVAPVAWAAVAVAAATVTLSLVNSLEKPSGVELFADRSTHSIWGMERWEVQSLPRPETAPVLRFLEERVPEQDAIALGLGENDFGFPAFGPRLERDVVLVPIGSGALDVSTAWLVSSPDRTTEIDRSCWAEAFASEGGTVFRRQEACA